MSEWISIEDRLPNSLQTVLGSMLYPTGCRETIRCTRVEKHNIPSDNDCVFAECIEGDDFFYVQEGWYELVSNWGDYSCMQVCEGIVTHWIEMPEYKHGEEKL